MKKAELAIVGGGAAGMFAAAVAAERGVKCVLVERKARLGSKVLMTANGRCNFTKDISPDEFLRDVATGGNEAAAKFVAAAVRACPPRAVMRGFESLHVPLRRMADGRMFPADGKAATIVHAFGDLLRDEEVPILTNCPVKEIVREVEKRGGGGQWNVSNPSDHRDSPPSSLAFLVRTANFDIVAENVLLATGGVSYPKTGSVGDGQNFARELGHRVTPYRPGLIGLETDDRRVTTLAGRRFEDGRAKVLDAFGRTLFDYRGEVDCESFGLSGAAIYNCQRFVEHAGVKDFSVEAWFGRQRLAVRNPKPRPVKEAIVTIGGVDLRDVDSKTMQSNLVAGLYFAGEVLDIDGPTGGYNLTLAFATARLAVASIAQAKAQPTSGGPKSRPRTKERA